jgi:aerobic-type carbon monoxide dehydrogenase small subunit (CoxS/CutS family)
MKTKINVNGDCYEVEASPATSLCDVIRETIGLTGVKKGCDSGGCGMCTVLLDNRPIYSCMTPFWKAKDKKILTVEGLAKEGHLTQLQESFIQNNAPQCGYCTPAMLLTAKALLDSNPHPTEEEVRHALGGVLCRCTGYNPYVSAIMQAADKSQKQVKELT